MTRIIIAGAGADIDVDDGARGILEQALSLEMKASGDFRDDRGAVIPW